MDFLYLLAKIRNPVTDTFFSLITHIGEETVFLVVAILFFWCVSKREGYYILITGLAGTVINQAAKLIFKIPRPWKIDPSFEFVGNADVEATGYSFPSGHTQNVTGTFGAIGRYSSKKWVRIMAVIVILLVAFSRMYLGVHTPLDVSVSLILGALLVFGLYPFFKTDKAFHKSMPYIVIISTLMSLGLILFVFLMSSDGVDIENLNSGKENAATLFGCTLGLIPVYILDRKIIRFETSGRWYSQVIKLVLGLCGVLLIKAGLSTPLELLLGNDYVARAVRYFLVVMFAGSVWPLTFKFFSRLKIGFLDKFTAFLRGKFANSKTDTKSA